MEGEEKILWQELFAIKQRQGEIKLEDARLEEQFKAVDMKIDIFYEDQQRESAIGEMTSSKEEE